MFCVQAENWVKAAANAAEQSRRLGRKGIGAFRGCIWVSGPCLYRRFIFPRCVLLHLSSVHLHVDACINCGNMQANGAGQDRESELSYRNGAVNGESSSTRAALSNGFLSVTNNGNAVCNSSAALTPPASNNNSTTDAKACVKKKRLSQPEEDVIRLIGQHLHDQGLK